MSLTIIIPVLDEAATLPAQLVRLAPLRSRGADVIVVDGGSRDGTPGIAAGAGVRQLTSPRGRAVQMNAGAAVAAPGTWLFLHSDTALPPDADRLVDSALARGRVWGRFDVRIDGRPAMLRIVAAMMNRRSALTGIATGDQAIFVTSDVFERVGGYPEQPLMEDVELSRRLRRLSRPARIRVPVVTSGRRWESRGVWRTIALMWWLRWRYWRGTPADVLARSYR